jgi:hypothetical protein
MALYNQYLTNTNEDKDMKKVEKKCKWCGKEFLTYPSETRKGGGKFCSRSCATSVTTQLNTFTQGMKEAGFVVE